MPSLEKRLIDGLEVLIARSQHESLLPPFLLVHGAFVGAWCWQDTYLPWLSEHGVDAYAFSFRGHGGSDGRGDLDQHSIDDYVADLAYVINWLEKECGQRPIVIGHSMGGYVTYRYLQQADVPAVFFLCSVPPQGLLLAQWRMLISEPGAFMDVNRYMARGIVNRAALRKLLFHHPVDDSLIEHVIRQGQPESFRALWDMTTHYFGFWPTYRRPRCPMWVMGGQCDNLIPVDQVESMARQLGVEAQIFPDMGHLISYEAGWQNVLTAIMAAVAAHVAETNIERAVA